MHSEFEESEAKIAATLAARQSAESGAKGATESAMSEASEATAAVDTLEAKLAEKNAALMSMKADDSDAVEDLKSQLRQQ